MTMYAYRVVSTIHDDVDMTSDDFVTELERARAEARTRVRQMGGDPLPNEQVILRASVENRTVRMIWRSRIIRPDDGLLVANIREQARQADTIVAWRLDYHRCGNHVRQPCAPWQTLVEEEA